MERRKGWKRNGVPVSGNFTTTVNSITLVRNSFPLSNVSVVPKLNGVSYPRKTSTINLAAFMTQATITGNNSLCSSSTSYSISNLPTGSTVVWSSSNPNVASVLPQSNNGVVVVRSATSGRITLTALITNPCGQVVTRNKIIQIGAPTPHYTAKRVEFCNFIYSAHDYAGAASNTYTHTWQLISSTGNVDFTTFDDSAQFLACPPFSITMKLTTTNSCGTTEQLVVQTLNGDDEEIDRISDPQTTSQIYPNPSNDIIYVDLGNSLDFNNASIMSVKGDGELYDMRGKMVMNIPISNKKTSFNVSKLKKGIYILKTNVNGIIENHRIIVN